MKRFLAIPLVAIIVCGCQSFNQSPKYICAKADAEQGYKGFDFVEIANDLGIELGKTNWSLSAEGEAEAKVSRFCRSYGININS